MHVVLDMSMNFQMQNEWMNLWNQIKVVDSNEESLDQKVVPKMVIARYRSMATEAIKSKKEEKIRDLMTIAADSVPIAIENKVVRRSILDLTRMGNIGSLMLFYLEICTVDLGRALGSDGICDYLDALFRRIPEFMSQSKEYFMEVNFLILYVNRFYKHLLENFDEYQLKKVATKLLCNLLNILLEHRAVVQEPLILPIQGAIPSKICVENMVDALHQQIVRVNCNVGCSDPIISPMMTLVLDGATKFNRMDIVSSMVVKTFKAIRTEAVFDELIFDRSSEDSRSYLTKQLGTRFMNKKDIDFSSVLLERCAKSIASNEELCNLVEFLMNLNVAHTCFRSNKPKTLIAIVDCFNRLGHSSKDVYEILLVTFGCENNPKCLLKCIVQWNRYSINQTKLMSVTPFGMALLEKLVDSPDLKTFASTSISVLDSSELYVLISDSLGCAIIQKIVNPDYNVDNPNIAKAVVERLMCNPKRFFESKHAIILVSEVWNTTRPQIQDCLQTLVSNGALMRKVGRKPIVREFLNKIKLEKKNVATLDS
ncbi:hypothetical protein ACOME3_010074 [Neoechinorhynchus agilis]